MQIWRRLLCMLSKGVPWVWSKVVNNICATQRDHQIMDVLVFVYLNIHLTIVKILSIPEFYFHLEWMLLIIWNTDFW